MFTVRRQTTPSPIDKYKTEETGNRPVQSVSSNAMRNQLLMFRILLVLVGTVASISCHGVATSSQSMVSGEGWRYSYGIAHGPHGIGHAVGESFPHGYGGFGTYAPGYGYHLVPPHSLPPRPIVVKLPPQYVVPLPPPIKPVVFPKPIPIVRPLPYVYAPYEPHHLNKYVYLDEHDHSHEHLTEHGHFANYADLFDHHHHHHHH